MLHSRKSKCLEAFNLPANAYPIPQHVQPLIALELAQASGPPKPREPILQDVTFYSLKDNAYREYIVKRVLGIL
jgi:hypothetical protein